jgi:hypothetical protein
MSAPIKAVNQFPQGNSYQGQNNALVSLGTPNNLFMPTTVTQMNATPLASNTNFNLASSNIMNLLGKPSLPASAEYRKVFVGKIPPGLSDHFITKLIEVKL